MRVNKKINNTDRHFKKNKNKTGEDRKRKQKKVRHLRKVITLSFICEQSIKQLSTIHLLVKLIAVNIGRCVYVE